MIDPTQATLDRAVELVLTQLHETSAEIAEKVFRIVWRPIVEAFVVTTVRVLVRLSPNQVSLERLRSEIDFDKLAHWTGLAPEQTEATFQKTEIVLQGIFSVKTFVSIDEKKYEIIATNTCT